MVFSKVFSRKVKLAKLYKSQIKFSVSEGTFEDPDASFSERKGMLLP